MHPPNTIVSLMSRYAAPWMIHSTSWASASCRAPRGNWGNPSFMPCRGADRRDSVMQRVKGMVQVEGTTYRISRVKLRFYEVVRILDNEVIGWFSSDLASLSAARA